MGPPYAIGESFGTVHRHHEGIKALWEDVWQKSCTRSIYPFNDSDIRDFEPVVEKLITVCPETAIKISILTLQNDINDSMEDDRWPAVFLEAMKELIDKADHKAKLGDEEASRMYMYVSFQQVILIVHNVG